MTSPVLNEQFYSGAFIVREANGYLSRDIGLLSNAGAADILLEGGLILSRDVPASATVAALDTNTGNGTFSAVTVASPALAGSAYIVNFEAATDFVVEGPNGTEVGHGVTGTAFNHGGLAFTITAGATAFAPGDAFTITTAAWDGGYVPYTGAAPAAAILFNREWVPATGTKKTTVITRLCEVNQGEVQWDPSVLSAGTVLALQAAAIASLAQLGIVFRQVAPSAG